MEQIVEATGAKIVLSSTRHYFRWQKDITCYKMYFCLEDELYGMHQFYKNKNGDE